MKVKVAERVAVGERLGVAVTGGEAVDEHDNSTVRDREAVALWVGVCRGEAVGVMVAVSSRVCVEDTDAGVTVSVSEGESLSEGVKERLQV